MGPLVYLLFFVPGIAFAANLEASLENLVNALLTRILPILALGYLGKNIFGHIQGDPEAKRQTPSIVISIIALLGINGVWAWLKAQVR